MPTPYNRFVYNLDLCVLAYQLHAQTLLFPFDPYFEDSDKANRMGSTRKKNGGGRKEFMRKATIVMSQQKESGTPLNKGLRGPGAVCRDKPLNGDEQGWTTDARLDAVFSDFTRVDPWRPGFTRPNGTKERLLVYNAPFQITDQISKVYFALLSGANGPNDPGTNPKVRFLKSDGTVRLFSSDLAKRPTGKKVPSRRGAPYAGAQPDTTYNPKLPAVFGNGLLYCFEGGTGQVRPRGTIAKGNDNRSLMGFCLARPVGTKSYDVHIVFRGSRSGQMRKVDAKMSDEGSADWVTDMKCDELRYMESICPSVKHTVRVSLGFGYSLQSMLPMISACLNDIARQMKEAKRVPGEIYVTGHSLGGALADLFAATMTVGQKPETMEDSVKSWSWDLLNLITFSKPPVGNGKLKKRFKRAIGSTIFNFSVKGDVVGSLPFPGIERFGECVTLKTDSLGSTKGLDTAIAHSPDTVRTTLIDTIHKRRSINPPPYDSIMGYDQDDAYVPAVISDTNGEIREIKNAVPWRSFDTLHEAFAHMAEIERCGLHKSNLVPHFFAPDVSLKCFAAVLEGQRPNLPATSAGKLASIIDSLVNTGAKHLFDNVNDQNWTVLAGLFAENEKALKRDLFDHQQLRALKVALLMFYIQGASKRYKAAVVDKSVAYFEDLVVEQHPPDTKS